MLQIALIGFFLLCAVGGLGVASGRIPSCRPHHRRHVRDAPTVLE